MASRFWRSCRTVISGQIRIWSSGSSWRSAAPSLRSNFYLLGYRPAIAVPIVLSLIVALFLRNVPILGAVLFGQVPSWQEQIWRRLTGQAAGPGGEIVGARRTSA
jgi:hypothetical protein